MSHQRVLYEAKLAKVGSGQAWAGAGLLLVCIVGSILFCLHSAYVPLIITGLAAVYFFQGLIRGVRLWKNAGIYQISMDDYGLYVHSDEPESAPTFSVIAPDIRRLIRKTIVHAESTDEHEYYIETKAGVRHRIGQLFTYLDLDVMELFEKISARFHWVEICEESER